MDAIQTLRRKIMLIFECTFGEGLQLASEFEEIHLQLIYAGKMGIKFWVQKSDNVNAYLKEKHQILQNNLYLLSTNNKYQCHKYTIKEKQK